MKHAAKVLTLLTTVVLMGFVAGCASLDGGYRTHRRSSVVDYLYPKESKPVPSTGTTVLDLPLVVGVAFVPEAGCDCEGGALTEDEKRALIEEVGKHFEEYEFVHSIQIIPSAYLMPQGGFTNLDQVSAMFGVDLVALVSYDQVQFTDEGLASIAYWTLVGMYVVPGEKNTTHTMLDAAVYDVPSRTLLFRAPGVNRRKGRATYAGLSDRLHKDSQASFHEASVELTQNLDAELQRFREKVKASEDSIQVAYKPGYTGAGVLDIVAVIVAAVFGGVSLWTRVRKRA